MQATRRLGCLSPAIVVGLLLFPLILGAQQRQLPPQDYGRWHGFSAGPVSADGRWNAYTMRHQGNRDTLFLKNIDTGYSYAFPAAVDPRLTADGRWLAMRISDTLRLLDTSTGRVAGLGKVAMHEFSADGNYLIAHAALKILMVKEIRSGTEWKFENVEEYVLSGNRVALAVRCKDVSSVQVARLGKGQIVTVAASGRDFSGIRWNSAGSAVAFYETAGDSVVGLHFYSDRLGHRVLDSAGVLSHGQAVQKKKLYVSGDGERLFFDVVEKKESGEAAGVDIWSSSAAELSFSRDEDDSRPFWHVWWPGSQKQVAIENDSFRIAVLAGDAKFALLRSEDSYRPAHRFGARYQDICLKDLATGQVALVAEKISCDTGTVIVSPGGKYIAYYKEGNWWTYEIASKRYSCMTIGSGVLWEGNGTERRGENHVYGCAGWSENDKDILLYSQYDIWKYPLSGARPVCLAVGAERKVRYRLVREHIRPSLREGSLGFVSESFDLHKGLLLKAEEVESGRQGLALWSGRGTVDLPLKDRKILSAARTGDGSRINAVESAFGISPRWFQADASGSEKEIAQANRHQKEYAWGRSELIRYDLGGKKINAVLVYPAGFDPEKKYPMVVFIYEKMSVRLHDYDFPSMQNSIGFNRTKLALDGYFVLMPDLEYQLNRVGASALEGVEAAVGTVLDKGFVDAGRIALMGHSFGGFEVAYIASRSSIFKTAIVGSGVHDLKGFYLGTDTSGRSNMERFWNGQFRNTMSFVKPEFEKESPLDNVEGISMPLLIWTGDSDENVPHWHSTQLHAALWKLGKESTLLVYRKEGHSLSVAENQIDLTRRIAEWLDFYLKDAAKPDWIK